MSAPEPKITVRYTCRQCRMCDVGVDVIARRSDEDLLSWMEKLRLLVADDHLRRSPRCHAEKLSELKIPVTGAGWVGGPTAQ